MRNFLLGSGMYSQPQRFGKIWALRASYAEAPMRAIVQVGDLEPRPWLGSWNMVTLRGNCGHVGSLLSGEKRHDFCGWSSGVLALALLAYNNESDFIYLEEDCLAFGPWVEQMYADMGDGDMVFGRKMTTAPFMECSQSLFLIRHSFIPHFVWQYIGQGPDVNLNNLPETKFARLEAMNSPGRIRRLSFGCDRERPIPFDDKVFFAQKWTEEELNEAKKRGLI